MSKRPIVEIAGLHKFFRRGSEQIDVLEDLTLEVPEGEFLALMGPSGSGKTTLLHVLAGILGPTSGQVLWNGRDVARLSDADRTMLRRQDFGFVFQQGMLLPELPAVDNVALPLLLDGVRRGAATTRARALFDPLGLDGLERRRPGELSGGEAQRVALARSLVLKPALLLADEPTGNLDPATGEGIHQLLREVNRDLGITAIVVTHNEELARSMPRRLRLAQGQVLPA